MWNILIVEDDKNDRSRLMEGLKELANCTLATSGIQALEMYQESKQKKKFFDFIFLDVNIPNTDGFDVLKIIRSIEDDGKRPKETKIIVISSYKDSLMENYNMGWDEFFSKPVDIPILINRMKQLCDK